MDHLPEILSFLAGLLSGLTIKIVYDKSKTNSIVQKNITAGGDVVGRDKF